MAIGEELTDISRLLAYKEKSLCQAENARNYKLCEKVTEGLMVRKSRSRELEVEKCLFEQKKKRASQQEMRIHRDLESSDIDTGPSSSRSSRSVTPLCGRSYSASSPSPINVHGSEQVISQPHSLSPASSSTLSVVSSQSATNELKHITSLLSPQPLSPTCCGSRMNPIVCELD